MKARFIVLSLVFVMSWFGLNQVVLADAAPPVGYWVGASSNGTPLSLGVSENGYAVLNLGYEPVSGTWSWIPNSNGGVLTISFMRVGFQNQLHYGILYLNSNEIRFGDNTFQFTLRRQR